ncbi:hypothetical protein SAMN05444365_10477 [Micromonospora pattaloongensis]|uniref:Secreted protein n=1 Tax=Micromonospora pattaloongensis TaxID=405436 RepID=A0A1H3NPP0_9ACTN|nr:hypothetical protein [Micromonospora pattaloongensis]SDY90385.1 hypothetical protein SAMN05444365_10477 [Micromonospora pattaloongensis]
MNLGDAPVKLGAYAGGLALVFAAAFAAGGVIDPIATPAPGGAHGATPEEGAAHPGAADPAGGHVPAAPAGLAVAERGYALTPAATTVPAGDRVPFTFTITAPDGAPVRDFTVSHEKELHLIVVRRDLTGFQHVHPARDAAGTWSVPLDLSAAGTYRVFADFTPAALGDGLTLGTDIAVAGGFTPAPLPAPAATAIVQGYEVRMEGTPQAGRESELTFTVRRDGREVTDLQPYLGAYGHLVSLRDGDLAYLHTHPGQEAHAGEPGGPQVRFTTTFPTGGAYRLFLDFRHGGVVRTAEFTVLLGDGAAHASSRQEGEPS